MADPYIDYNQGAYSTGGVQDLLRTMTGGRWNTQWEDPNLQSTFADPSGSQWTLGRTKTLIDKGINDFTQQVQAVTGRAPTADEISNFFQNQINPMASQAQPGGYNPINPQDITSAVQQYVPTAFSKDIQGYQQQQQGDALKQNLSTGNDLISQAMGKFSSNLTDPNNPMYQQFSGNMNNMGITPSSGAFQAGLGGTIANKGADMENQLMMGLGLPALSGIQGLSGQANQNLQGAAPTAQANLTSHQNDLSDFGRQQNLMKAMMDSMSGGNGMWGNIIGGGLQGAVAGGAKGGIPGAIGGGAAGAGGGYAKSQNTWICTAMVEAGVMTRDEVEALHDHLYKAFWFKPFKFLGYILFGKLLVYLANSVQTDWRVWKPAFYQEVMTEPNSVKALNLYEQAFWDLFRVIRQRKSSRVEVNHGA